MKIRHLFLLGVAFTFAIGMSRKSGASCANQNFQFDPQYMACIYSDPITKVLRRTVRAYLQNKSKYKDSEETFPIVKPYLHLFSQKFIALETWDGDFGGNFVIVAIGKNLRFLRFWIYKTDGEDFEYEIREIEELDLIPSEKVRITELLGKKYSRFWL